MRLRYAIALVLGGCAVSVGNPGEPKGRLAQLSGLVVNMEDQQPLRTSIHLEGVDEFGDAITAAAASATDGTYAFAKLPEGLYAVRIGTSFSYEIPVSANTRFDVFLPTPAAPTNFRGLLMEAGLLCFLWDDRSGLEAGFRLAGVSEHDIPANKQGIVIHEELTSGSYILSAYNEYGESATAATTIDDALAEEPIGWRDRERCEAAEGELPAYLEMQVR